VFFFFGLVYALAVAVYALWRSSRAERGLRP